MSRFTLRDGTNIWYKLKGKGPLLVLNHGYTSSHQNFTDIISLLKNEFRCLSWDCRGHGKSDKPIGNTYEQTAQMYSLPQFVEDCYELLIRLEFIGTPKSEKLFMYGVSMGGILSQLFAIKYEHTLRALALGATTSNLNHPFSKERMSGNIPLTRNGKKLKARLGFSKKFLEDHPDFLKKKITQNFFIMDDELLVMPENVLKPFDLEKHLQKLTIPVIIFHGEKDLVMKIEYGKRLSQVIPNSEFYPFPEVGHNINGEIPRIIAHRLKNFFLKIEH
ncbi:MAG: putative 3-oxoadipate enol-lactonase [Promethearchaeota archaeon]|nr:MAG: putative 3-oxoadipate enol-lactonase [Candidatus Lokiarchaeota archaeon]